MAEAVKEILKTKTTNMNEKKKTFQIEHLDSGFVLSEEGKRTAYSSQEELKQHLEWVLIGMLNLSNKDVHNTIMSIEVDTNFFEQ